MPGILMLGTFRIVELAFEGDDFFLLLSFSLQWLFLFIYLIFFYYSYVHTMLGSFLSPALTPSSGYFLN
jgi:hypothetical protein